MVERARITKTVVDCVDCGDTITLSGRVEIGQIVRCVECGAAMEVVSLDPVEVDWISRESAYADDGEAW
jgi:lysine biosynthesis protein LysW